MIACREVIRSAPNPEDQEHDAEENKSDLRGRQQEAELQRDVAGHLEKS